MADSRSTEHGDLALEELAEVPLVIDTNGNCTVTVSDATKYLRAVEKETKKTKSRKRKASTDDVDQEQVTQPKQRKHRPRPLNSAQQTFRKSPPLDAHPESPPTPDGGEDQFHDEDYWGQWTEQNGFQRARSSTRPTHQGRAMHRPSQNGHHHYQPRREAVFDEEEYAEQNGMVNYHRGPTVRYDREFQDSNQRQSRPPPSRQDQYYDDRGQPPAQLRGARQPSRAPPSRPRSDTSGEPLAKKRKIQELREHTPRRIAPVPRRAGSQAPRNAVAGPSRAHQREPEPENNVDNYDE